MALIKRAMDLIFCVSVVVFLLPVFVVLWVAIKVSSKGPAVFKQQRAGKDGRPFIFYKFRTMKTDADPFGASPKSSIPAKTSARHR